MQPWSEAMQRKGGRPSPLRVCCEPGTVVASRRAWGELTRDLLRLVPEARLVLLRSVRQQDGGVRTGLSLFGEEGVMLDLAPLLDDWEPLLERGLSLVGPGWWAVRPGETYGHLVPVFVEDN